MMSRRGFVTPDWTTVYYLKTSFDAADAADVEFGAGVWYGEFVDGIVRRQFEVYTDRTLIAPYDIGFTDQFTSVLEDDHYAEILLAEFEEAWERCATVRLRQLIHDLST